MKFYKTILIALVIFLLIYTRFLNLKWGLPYPFHPDERNMANAIQQLQCPALDFSLWNLDLSNCFNPHFFAYGQLSLYIVFFLIQIVHFAQSNYRPVSFEEATLGLRVLSATASVLNVLVIMKIMRLLRREKSELKLWNNMVILLVLIFSPYFIQLSHFGTTESLLMLFYSMIVYLSLKSLYTPGMIELNHSRCDFILLSFFCGLAIATKVSALLFIAVPLLVLLFKFKAQNSKFKVKFLSVALHFALYTLSFLLLTAFVSLFFSPHNLISSHDFMNSISYESSVGTGESKVFYTRQFEGTLPILFQIQHIFPYALGWPIFLLSMLGFFLLPYDKKHNVLRIAFLIYFLPNAFVYAKWTRFMAPIFPLMSIFAILFIFRLQEWSLHIQKFSIFNFQLPMNSQIKNYLRTTTYLLITSISVLPGVAFLSIYQNPDVRFTASNWIYNNIPSQAKILSETANVVDIPIPPPHDELRITNYELKQYLNYVSFDFYNLDQDSLLQNQLQQDISTADYIFVPSRRIFMNHYCDKIGEAVGTESASYPICLYPLLNQYYNNLFSGQLGFQKVAEFNAYPQISLFGKTFIEFPDEQAEETWTVFDHPVVRIYKRS